MTKEQNNFLKGLKKLLWGLALLIIIGVFGFYKITIIQNTKQDERITNNSINIKKLEEFKKTTTQISAFNSQVQNLNEKILKNSSDLKDSKFELEREVRDISNKIDKIYELMIHQNRNTINYK